MTREEVAKELMKHYYTPAPTDWTAMDSMLRLADWHLEKLRERTEECAKIYDTHTPPYQHIDRVKEAILALNEPPKPVWCKHVRYTAAKHWVYEALGVNATIAWSFCPECGKPKPTI